MRRSLLTALFCTLAFAAVAAETPSTGLDSDANYREAVRLIKAEQYDKAIPLLMTLDTTYPQAPGILNWLGFSHRKLKNYPTAKQFYDAALKIEPTYRPALEYQGMWFIETGDIVSAKANLAKLMAICASCEETGDLVEALKKAGH